MDYLVARIEALVSLVNEVVELASDRGLATPWRAAHRERLRAHRQHIAALAERDAAGTTLGSLALRCDLDVMDEDILVLALAVSLDRTVGRSLGLIQQSFSGGAPTVDVVVSLLTDDLAGRLRALTRFSTGPLAVHGLISLTSGRGATDLIARQVHVPAHVQRELLGDRAAPLSVAFASIVEPRWSFHDIAINEEDRANLLGVLTSAPLLASRTGHSGPQLILLTGTSGTGKTSLAHACAAAVQRKLLRVDTQGLLARGGDINAALRELLVETKLSGALLFFDECELLFATRLQGNRHLQPLLDNLDTIDDAVLLATGLEGMLDPSVHRRIALRLNLGVPSPSLREWIWHHKLSPQVSADDGLDIAFLAEKYEFNGAQIDAAARYALAQALARDTDALDLAVTDQDLEDGAEAQMRHHLEQLAVQSTTHLKLEDVVLPEDLLGVIRSVIAAARNRRRIFEEWGFGERLTTGRGLAMLFRGESGTGKTLTAETLGAELAMPLYRVAIPRIVSKYIGETEENLEKAFKEAQVAGAILLFDEADAIFTKRVDVGTATDRYSNMEVNLLLQELERFEGIVILTTNLDAAIDDAFDRRLNYKLDFPFPTAELRRRIWSRHLPPKAPIDLDDDELSYLADHFELSGGSIKNVVLRAAYAAAERGSTLNVENLEAASIQEYRELGKLVRS